MREVGPNPVRWLSDGVQIPLNSVEGPLPNQGFPSQWFCGLVIMWFVVLWLCFGQVVPVERKERVTTPGYPAVISNPRCFLLIASFSHWWEWMCSFWNFILGFHDSSLTVPREPECLSRFGGLVVRYEYGWSYHTDQGRNSGPGTVNHILCQD